MLMIRFYISTTNNKPNDYKGDPMNVKNTILTTLFLFTLILSPLIMAEETAPTQDQIDCETVKELKVDLQKLKDSYDKHTIDKETYKKEHKMIVDRIRTINGIEEGNDQGLVDDVLFSGAETDLGVPSSTAEEELEYIQEKNLDE